MSTAAANKSDYAQLISDTELALDEGRTPRNGRDLQLAAVALLDAGQIEPGVRALRALARLELRRANFDRASRWLRTAFRSGKHIEPSVEIEGVLELLAELAARAGDYGVAISQAEALLIRARRRADDDAVFAATERMLRCVVAAGRHSEGLEKAEAALEAEIAAAGEDSPRALQAELLLCSLLLHSGCPMAADARLTLLLRSRKVDEDPHAALWTRGQARLCVNNLEGAARDFRRLRVLLKDAPDARPELLAALALATADVLRATAERNPQRLEKAKAAHDRYARRISRVRDPLLSLSAESLHAAVGHDAVVPLSIPTVKAAGESLVALARNTLSETVVDACIQEVRRLGRLPEDAPAYRFPPAAELEVSP